ncbi:lysophospholipid acyltransferase family protein [Poriferisphaera sp. WC338]|uniref:lysophospholipid acyltransferase family protein n=1 Tax=Poriferisphaera sp. WC338 TaxID=3425129 RepID=UPI003D819329
MLDFSDKPYEYFEPRYSWFWAPFLRWYNRRIYLPKKKKIMQVELQNEQVVRGLKSGNTHVMVVANHPTHADAAIAMETCRRVGLRTQFMAAYDVYLRSKVDAWVMQKMGAFSVDRESSDTKAMKAAADSLSNGRLELTIFPEGNVYLENERVTPFHDGAALLAARGAKSLKESGKRLVVLPLAIKASYTEEVKDRVNDLLNRMLVELGCDIDDEDGPLEKLRRIGAAAIIRNLKHRGMDVAAYDVAGESFEATQAMIHEASNRVLDVLEKKLGVESKHDVDGMERVRQCRRVIHEILSDPEKEIDHAAARTWADEAMTAMKVVSYSGDYVAEKQSADRIAETTEKLAEDVYGRMWEPIGERKAIVRFCEPIDVTAMLAAQGEKVKLRKVMAALTEQFETSIQASLDETCEFLVTEGMSNWTKANNQPV